MLDKLNQIGAASKKVVLYILTPAAFFLGFIYYLLHRKDLEIGDLEKHLGQVELNDTFERTKNAKKEADDLEAAYRSARNNVTDDKPPSS